MKRITLLVIFIVPMLLCAQNVQLHYDLGEDRNYFTSTIEMFKPDEYGATFFFFDMDYNYQQGEKSASLAYLEFARYISLPFDKFSATIQYNDGVAPWGPLGPVWLGGASYPIDLGFITLNTDLLLRKSRGSDAPDAQLTLVWTKMLLNDKLTFTGFFDLWTQDDGSGDKQAVLLTEPQLWYGVTNHLSLGGEVELSKNFVSDDFEIMPTLGLKWQF